MKISGIKNRYFFQGGFYYLANPGWAGAAMQALLTYGRTKRQSRDWKNCLENVLGLGNSLLKWTFPHQPPQLSLRLPNIVGLWIMIHENTLSPTRDTCLLKGLLRLKSIAIGSNKTRTVSLQHSDLESSIVYSDTKYRTVFFWKVEVSRNGAF